LLLRRDVRRRENLPQLVVTAKCPGRRINHFLAWNVERTRNASPPTMTTRNLAAILSGIASVQQGHTLLANEGEHILRRGAQLWLHNGSERGGRIRGNAGTQGPILTLPLRQSPIEHNHLIVTIIVQRPPEAGGKFRGRMSVIGDYEVLIANAQTSHRCGETGRRSNLRLHSVVGINDIAAPIDVERPRNVSLRVLFASANIQSILDAIVLDGLDIAAHIHDAQMAIVQVIGEPRSFYQETTTLQFHKPSPPSKIYEGTDSAPSCSAST